MEVWRQVLHLRTGTEEEIMKKKLSWPSLLFALYVVAVVVMGVVALGKIGPF